MINRRTGVCALGIFSLLSYSAASAVGADTLESVEKKLLEAGKKINSLTFTSHSINNYDMPDYKMKQEIESTGSYLRQGEKMLSRIDMETDQTTYADGGERREKTHSTIINDGEFTYAITENLGQKMVMKSRSSDQGWFQDPNYFSSMKQMYDIKVIGDESVDGRSAYVIELTSKPGTQPDDNEMVMTSYHDKDTGMVIKAISKDKLGQTSMHTTITHIKVNTKVDESQFVFKMPEGAQLVDMTKMQPQGAPGNASNHDEEDTADDDGDGDPEAEDEKPKESKRSKFKKPKWPKLP